MAFLTPRERVAKTLKHQEPDRVPIDIGGGVISSLTVVANERLKRYLGISSEDPLVDRIQQLVRPCEEVLKRLHCDTRYLYLKAPSGWADKELANGLYEDEFGIRRKRAGYYYDMVDHPLKQAQEPKDLENYPWPDPHDPSRYEGLEEARQLYENTDYALVVNVIGSIFELSWYLVGYTKFLIDLLVNPALAEALMDRVLEHNMGLFEEVLDRTGSYLSYVLTGDDVGTQQAPTMSPELYRRYVKPRQKKLIQFIKSKTQAPVLYHSCGAVYPLLEDFIDMGVDIFHPAQPRAHGFEDSAKIKREYGRRLSFMGGIDQQQVLPFGTVEEVKEEARRAIEAFAPGGGYIFNPSHNIQGDVPPENILALFDAAWKYGEYPIRI